MFYAISYLMGLSEINQKELILRLFKIAVVLAFLDPALINLTTKTRIQLDPSKTIEEQYSFKTTTTFGFWFYQKYVINIILIAHFSCTYSLLEYINHKFLTISHV